MAAATGTRNAKRTINISSSEATESTRTPSEILELGSAIVKEMGLDDDTDTLGRWMCHHVASLIEEASKKSASAARLAAQREAVSTILALWEKRASLPGNGYPLARHKYLLQCLAATSPDASIWESHHRSPLMEASGDAFRDVAAIVNIVLSFESKPPLFTMKKRSVPNISITFLKMFEQKILTSVEDLDDSSLELLQSNGNKTSTSDQEIKALQSLLKCIERTHKTLEKLAEQTRIKLATRSNVASQKRMPAKRRPRKRSSR